MLELGVGADIVRGIGWVFQVAFVAALALALWRGKTWRRKLAYVTLVLLVFVGPALPGMYRTFAAKQKYAKAKALFDERCKTAGEKIYRTVENVEGVLLLNVRSRGASASVLEDANWPDAALPSEPGQDGYIMTFLLWEHHEDKRNDRGYLNNKPSNHPGYRFVDVRGTDDSVLRYRLVLPNATEMASERAMGNLARYAVSFTNMTDPVDRAMWVAGTKVVILDTLTREVVAEKTWYSLEPGQGSTYGGRSPWAFAMQCPSYRGWSGGSTRFFVDQVLKPKQGE